MKKYIGIDNGVSGAVGIVDDSGYFNWFIMPVISVPNYQKDKHNITRINVPVLKGMLEEYSLTKCRAFVERPMVNPVRFKASTSALRALEATLIVLESLDIGYSFVDSKAWQKEMLPRGTKGDDLKTMSLGIAKRLWPKIDFPKKSDGDAILIAEYARKNKL